MLKRGEMCILLRDANLSLVRYIRLSVFILDTPPLNIYIVGTNKRLLII